MTSEQPDQYCVISQNIGHCIHREKMMIVKTVCLLSLVLLVSGATIPSDPQPKKEKNTTSVSSVPTKHMITRMCSDLCVSGLGGVPCGRVCDNLNVNFKELKKAAAAVSNGTLVKKQGSPRRNVCPLLCAYALGDPLCECDSYEIDRRFLVTPINWNNICVMFCEMEGLTVYGCRKCDEKFYAKSGKNIKKYLAPASRKNPQSPSDKEAEEDAAKNTVVGALREGGSNEIPDWPAVCHDLCLNGEGGLACNCDLNP
ncbi:uncharacterized protein [Anabrus simplex]|uniref:uncharacterized protein n=1 Tax=Anabrus simplex TaxID=316456 RepID=UPI0035A2E8B5